MSEIPTRYSKHYFSISNADGQGAPNSFTVFMNNASFTNLQSYGTQTNVDLTPICFSANLNYDNVSQYLQNNKIKVSGTNILGGPVYLTIPDGIYTPISYAAKLQELLIANVKWTSGATAINWTVEFLAPSQGFLIKYTTADPAGGSAINFEFYFLLLADSLTYDSRRVSGFNGDVATIAYAARATGITSKTSADFQPYESIYVASNLAKRFWKKRNGVLAQTNILFEIPLKGATAGSTLVWEPTNYEIYKQQIMTNFNEISVILVDKEGKLIPLYSTAEVTFTFMIERTIQEMTPEEKAKSIENYAQYVR